MLNNETQELPEFDWWPASEWTWSRIVHKALAELGSTASLSALYGVIERHPRTKTSKHWKAKIRQTLERSDQYVRIEKGVWSFASRHSAQDLEKFRSLRRERYPGKAKSES